MARYIKLTLDWDGTLTKDDTMFMMGKIAAQRDSRTGQSKDDPISTWASFGKAYAEDYATHKKTYVPLQSERQIPESEAVWLQSLRGVENRSAQRVHDSGFFKGVKAEDVTNAARQALDSGAVVLRPGWTKLFHEAAAARVADPYTHVGHVLEINVLSVNWSETLIRETLRLSAQKLSESDPTRAKNLNDYITNMLIQANEIEGLFDANGSTGALNRANRLSVRTSLDKLQYLTRSSDQIHVYVGDSPTDLDCLIAADVGIVIRSQPATSSQIQLTEALERVGIHAAHVFDRRRLIDSMRQDGTGAKAKLWWAQDLDEIAFFLSQIPV